MHQCTAAFQGGLAEILRYAQNDTPSSLREALGDEAISVGFLGEGKEMQNDRLKEKIKDWNFGFGAST